MPEIIRILDNTEVEYGLLKVKDLKPFYPKPKQPVIIIDDDGEKIESKMHSVVPRIDGLTKLLKKHNAKIGDKVNIRVEVNQIGTFKVKFENKLLVSDNIINEVTKPEIVEEDLLITPSLESMLEDFIVNNLNRLEPNLNLYKDEGGVLGRQYDTDVGIIDLLCIDANKNFVVIELKKGRESDKVVGQISRYIGWVQEKLAQNQKKVRGIIIVHKPTSTYSKDDKLYYAVLSNPNIELRYYEISLNFFERGKKF